MADIVASAIGGERPDDRDEHDRALRSAEPDDGEGHPRDERRDLERHDERPDRAARELVEREPEPDRGAERDCDQRTRTRAGSGSSPPPRGSCRRAPRRGTRSRPRRGRDRRACRRGRDDRPHDDAPAMPASGGPSSLASHLARDTRVHLLHQQSVDLGDHSRTRARHRARAAAARRSGTPRAAGPGAADMTMHPVGEQHRLAHVVRDEHERLAAVATRPTRAAPRPAAARAPARRARRTARRRAARRGRTRGRARAPRAVACPPTARAAARRRTAQPDVREPVHCARSRRSSAGDADELERQLDVAATDSHGNSAGSWNSTARSGPGPVIGGRPGAPRPLLGASSPARMFRSVVLPHPLGPEQADELARRRTSNDTWSPR